MQGVQGFNGATGLQGFQGVQGVQGFQGRQGFQGVQGVQGVQGFNGATGLQGFQGVQGVQGLQGFTGATGRQGFQGAAGAGSIGGTATQIAWFSGPTTITSDSNLFWNQTNRRLGIATASPAYTLDAFGNARILTSLGVGIAPSVVVGRIDASNDIVSFSTSDIRLKENIKPVLDSLDKLSKLNGVEFDWRKENESIHGYKGHDIGVIAQEIKDVLPEAVRENETGYLSVRYEKIVPLLIEAIKDQQKQIDELKTIIKSIIKRES